MKKLHFIVIVLLATVCWQTSFAQQNAGEATLYYKLRSDLATFYEANQFLDIETDTLFYVDKGFKIYPGVRQIRKGDTDYMVLTYPDFNGAAQPFIGNRSSRQEELAPAAVYYPLVEVQGLKRNGKYLIIEKKEFEQLKFDSVYSLVRGKNKVQTGQLTIPFKLRPKQGDQNFKMTTDVTVGAYVGFRQRLSRTQPFFVIIPFNLGLTFINVNDNSTTTTSSDGLVPGFTWATGVIFEYNKFNAGVVLGRDYASEIGDEWIYQNKTWYSFAIGYSFMR